MAHRKTLWVLGGTLALCCVAGGITITWGVQSVPPISQQLPENYSRLVVQIASPLPRTRWPLNSFIPIIVQAQAAERIKRVELFINDTPLTPQNGSSDSFSGSWRWQPGVAGQFMLMARAVSQSGAVSVSSPVLITAMRAAWTISPVNARAGETLQGIAQEKAIPIEEIQQANPHDDPNLPLKSGQQIFVPNPPAPVTNPHIISALPPGYLPPQSIVTAAPGPSSAPQGPSGPTTNFVNNLTFLWQFNNPPSKDSKSGPKYPPSTPTLFGDFKGCDVNLRFDGQNFEDMDPSKGWMGTEEDGFFVYRSRDGGPAERIYTIPAIHGYIDAQNNSKFSDKAEYGTLVYYVSAFNTLGEAASNPVTIALNPGVCPPAGNAGSSDAIHMDSNGDIILPFQMDTAYLYLQINGSGAVRVPEGNRMFLPGSGMRFNIYSYLSTQADKVQTPDLKLHMEVWGWQGGALKYAGAFDTETHGTVLTICSVEGEGACTNGNGSWVGSVNLPHDKPINDLVYEMRWQVTSLTTADDLHLWLSQQPFTEQNPQGFSNSKGLIYAGSLGRWVVNGKYLNTKGNEGFFSLRLGDMLYPNPPPAPLGWDNTPSRLGEYRSEGFQEQPVGQPFTLYAQVSPNLAMQGYAHASNSVSLLYDTSALPPPDMPPLVSQFSSMYTVEILRDQFKQASHSVGALWGCVVVDEDPTGTYAVPSTVCPPVPTSGYEWFPGDDPCGDIVSWFENCLLGGVEAAYNAFKDTLAGAVAAIIPGCSDSTTCQDIIHKGVDYGAAYLTGIPPDLPSAEDLVSGQISSEIIDLATGGVASATGIDESVLGDFCDDVADCQGKLSEPIKAQLKQSRSQASQAACGNPIEAYYHNVQAFCLDPSIVVHPAPGAIDSPAVALVRVTRKNTSESQAVTEADQDKYRLFVTVSADPPQGSSMKPTDPFWKAAQVSIPWLQPGESVVLPATLEHIPYQDLDKYFTNGVGHMKALETCYSSNSSWDWVPCQNGGSDSWDFTILWNSALQGAIVQP